MPVGVCITTVNEETGTIASFVEIVLPPNIHVESFSVFSRGCGAHVRSFYGRCVCAERSGANCSKLECPRYFVYLMGMQKRVAP